MNTTCGKELFGYFCHSTIPLEEQPKWYLMTYLRNLMYLTITQIPDVLLFCRNVLKIVLTFFCEMRIILLMLFTIFIQHARLDELHFLCS